MNVRKPTRQRMLTPRDAVEHNLKGLPRLIGTIRKRLREWPEYHPGIDRCLFCAQVEADAAVKLLRQPEP